MNKVKLDDNKDYNYSCLNMFMISSKKCFMHIQF